MNILKNTFIELAANRSDITNGQFLEIVSSVYGEKKVRDVCERYHLFKPKENTKKLKRIDAEKIHLGLRDIKLKDLDRIVKKCHWNEQLTPMETAVLNELNEEQKEALKHYNHATELPSQLFNDLLKAFKTALPEFKTTQTLSLEKISGIPGKYFQHGWLSHQSGRSLEDAERLRIYEEIESLKPKDQARYCELLSKILVKKHLYYEKKNENELKLGMLIPGMKGADGQPRWYQVSEIMDSGWGKFGYRLVPATKGYAADMPDLILYRSSATLPTAMDSFTSYLNDLNVLPPGYLSRHHTKKKEIRWFTEATPCLDGSTRPLLITGHSLGAVNSQIGLMNLQKSDQWPDRKISLELFDSPAVASSDVKDFAKHYNGRFPLTINYYVSEKDLAPYAGSLISSSYLGNYIKNNEVTAAVHQMKLTRSGSKNKAISGLGPHGRIFFRGKKGKDFKVLKTNIEVFDKKTKRLRLLFNLQKLVLAIFAWGILGPAGGIKRFFFGRRHHDATIKKIFRKISQKHKITSKPKIQTLIEREIKSISHKKDMIEIELLNFTLEVHEEMEKRVLEGILECDEKLKKIKAKKFISNKNEVIALKKLKADFKRLNFVIREKVEILQAREHLYGNAKLKDLPNFQLRLKELQKNADLNEGCKHLQLVLLSQMKISSTAISEKDLIKLKDFQKQIEHIDPDLAQLISSQSKIINSHFQRKKDLLIHLSHEIFEGPQIKLSNEQKIKLFVRAEQILNNPFETPIDPLNFLKSLNNIQDDKLSQLTEFLKREILSDVAHKNEFWDVVPILEKKAHHLAVTQEQKNFLVRCKMEGLKAIATLHPKEQQADEVLIIGAGPSGLMQAISLTLNGKPFQIFESRSEQKKERDNVIVLGKDNPRDIRILLFLGLISRWERDNKVTLGRYRDSMVEVKIADVENSLKTTLKEMNDGDDHICYNQRIVSITQDNNKAKVKTLDGMEINPSMIIVTDGFAGTTRKMLGISREVLSKTTQIIYTIFQQPLTSPAAFQKLKYRINSRIQALSFIIKIMVHALFKSKSVVKSYGLLNKGGPSALFRIPNQDYIGRSARENERNFINKYRDEIKKLEGKIKKIKDTTPQEVKLLSTLVDQKNKINAEFHHYLTKVAKEAHAKLDALHGMKRRKHHRLQLMKVKRNVVVDVTITKAERSHIKVGNTLIHIRGDASHSTDPASGYGCKTAIEETLADQFTFSNNSIQTMNALELACQQWGHRHYQDEMINKGFRSRFMDVTQSELIERYVDLGLRESFLTEEEGLFLAQIAQKSEKKLHNPLIEISDQDWFKAKKLQIKMIQTLKKLIQERNLDPNHFKSLNEPSLSRTENALLTKMIKLILKNPKKIHADDFAKMDALAAKMCCKGIQEGIVLALLLKIPRQAKK